MRAGQLLALSVIFGGFCRALSAPCTAYSSTGATDWLVTRCEAKSTFVEIPGGFVLNNTIVSRTFRTTCASTLYTESVRSEASGEEKLVAAAPEATMLAPMPVFVGGLGNDSPGAVQLTFSGYRVGTPLERFPFVPGRRGSHETAWPPAGIRVSFDHTAPCAAFGAGLSGVFTTTVSYELYDSVAAFGKSVTVSHNCTNGTVIQLLNLTTDLVALSAVGRAPYLELSLFAHFVALLERRPARSLTQCRSTQMPLSLTRG